MGSDGIWERGAYFLPTSDGHCRPGRFPDMPGPGEHVTGGQVAQPMMSPGVVCWLFGSWPCWPSQAVPADGSERVVVGGFGVWCGVQARRAVPLFFICLAPAQRERRTLNGNGGGVEREKMGEACGLQDAHHSQRVPVWRARRAWKARQGGEAAFCLDLFRSSSAVPERFLDLPACPVFADTIILASLETTRLVELLRVLSLVKAEPSVATREPSTMAPKGALWQGPGPI